MSSVKALPPTGDIKRPSSAAVINDPEYAKQLARYENVRSGTLLNRQLFDNRFKRVSSLVGLTLAGGRNIPPELVAIILQYWSGGSTDREAAGWAKDLRANTSSHALVFAAGAKSTIAPHRLWTNYAVDPYTRTSFGVRFVKPRGVRFGLMIGLQRLPVPEPPSSGAFGFNCPGFVGFVKDVFSALFSSTCDGSDATRICPNSRVVDELEDTLCNGRAVLGVYFHLPTGTASLYLNDQLIVPESGQTDRTDFGRGVIPSFPPQPELAETDSPTAGCIGFGTSATAAGDEPAPASYVPFVSWLGLAECELHLIPDWVPPSQPPPPPPPPAPIGFGVAKPVSRPKLPGLSFAAERSIGH